MCIRDRLDSINPLQLNSLVLSDNHRINNRFNTLFVLDYSLPKMNISYSGLNSSINKDVKVYQNQYGLSGDDQRNYNTGQTPNSIGVSTETWKLDREILPNLKLDLGYSFSKSVNGDTSKVYQFRERYAYTENVSNKSLSLIHI